MLVKVGVPLTTIYPTVHDALAKNGDKDDKTKAKIDDNSVEAGIVTPEEKENGYDNQSFEKDNTQDDK